MRTQFLIFLSILTFFAVYDVTVAATSLDVKDMYVHLLLTVLSILTFVYIFKERLKITQLQYQNIAITGIIMFLLVHPSEPFWIIPVALYVTFFIKKFGSKITPIFNPAAFGLVVTYYITVILKNVGLMQSTLLVSWWGTDFQQVFTQNSQLLSIIIPAFLLLTSLYFVSKFKKGIYAATFFLTVFFMVFLNAIGNVAEIEKAYSFLVSSLFSSYAFFVFIMLVEPKTSPIFTKSQVFIGIIGGIMYYLVNLGPNALFLNGVPILTTLLIINFLAFLSRDVKALK